MAFAILSEELWRRAEEEAKTTGKDAFEIYKRKGGNVKEGTNEEIENIYKVVAIFDEEETTRPSKRKKK